jgi:hypothetical protein
MVFEEHPDVSAVCLHQAEDVRHHLTQFLSGREVESRSVIMLTHEEIDELIVNPVEDLVLATKVVIQRGRAEADRAGDLLHTGVVVALTVEQRCGLVDELPPPHVTADRPTRRLGISAGAVDVCVPEAI